MSGIARLVAIGGLWGDATDDADTDEAPPVACSASTTTSARPERAAEPVAG
jgi:hypothetical protein